MDKRHLLHTTIYCSAMSPCGKYLAVGNNYGYIALFNLSNALLPNSLESSKKPVFVYHAHPGPIHSMLTTQNFLISAGYGSVVGWKWIDIMNNKPTKTWTLNREQESSPKSLPQISTYNCMCYKAKDDMLYTGGDDNIALLWDLNTGTCVDSYTGHTAYIHDVDLLSDSLVTASEDGSVKVWDSRSNGCLKTISPNSNKRLNRPDVGKWISCVAADPNGEWLALGGGPNTSLWHVRSSTVVSPLSVSKSNENNNSNFIPNTLCYHDDEIIAGGNQPVLNRWHVNGEKKAAIPCSIGNVFSLSFKSSPSKGRHLLPMAVTGASWKINIFTNLGYLGMSLSLV